MKVKISLGYIAQANIVWSEEMHRRDIAETRDAILMVHDNKWMATKNGVYFTVVVLSFSM